MIIDFKFNLKDKVRIKKKNFMIGIIDTLSYEGTKKYYVNFEYIIELHDKLDDANLESDIYDKISDELDQYESLAGFYNEEELELL